MSTSGKTVFNVYCSEIVESAVYKAGLVKLGEEIPAKLMNIGLFDLNSMILAWQSEDVFLWTVDVNQEMTLVQGQSLYTLTPNDTTIPEVIDIQDIRLRSGSSDIPLGIQYLSDFSSLTDNTVSGTPTTVYITKSNPFSFYLFPVPDAISASSLLVFNQIRRLEHFTYLSNTPDFPSNWIEAITFGLAARLNPKDTALTMWAEDTFYRARGSNHNSGNIQLSPRT